MEYITVVFCFRLSVGSFLLLTLFLSSFWKEKQIALGMELNCHRNLEDAVVGHATYLVMTVALWKVLST